LVNGFTLGEVKVNQQACRNSQSGNDVRERALLDTDRRAFWLAKADEWAQRANDEIASLLERAVARQSSNLK
jgi:hypothetical protein